MQVKLLRAIQEKSIRPVGAQQETSVDVRIISATHKDLPTLVEQGEFRQDLFYRINVIELHIPPLRERREDIPLLVDSILSRLSQRNQPPALDIEAEALKKLCGHPLPGNVRELENILERSATLLDGSCIGSNDLLLPETPDNQPSVDENLPLEEYLEQVEKKAIIKALNATKWNRTAAAKKLGLSFRALRYRLNKLNIE